MNYAEWCVFYKNNGHYFPTREEAEKYLRKRKFLKG
nr:MAG TPA: ribonuclease HI [Caudoviricetes sp.]